MFNFKPTQKFRIIINGVSIIANARSIRNGIGDQYNSNAAVQKALLAFEYRREYGGAAQRSASGFAGQWEGFNVQLDIMK
jgi:hypothetical protein